MTFCSVTIWGMCLFCIDARLESFFFVVYLTMFPVAPIIEEHSKKKVDLFSHYQQEEHNSVSSRPAVWPT
jgi:hypothetical protein